jgi:ribosome maturation factor RimP
VTSLPPRVLELASEAAADQGVEVLEALITGGPAGRTLRVTLDADTPIASETVEKVSRQLSRALDDEDPLPGRYTLEVGTPGLDRPLTTARDFRRQQGHPVRITPAEGAALPAADKNGQVQGVVVAVDGDTVTLDVDGEEIAVRLPDVGKGKVVLPW